jgi:hypothetical protein
MPAFLIPRRLQNLGAAPRAIVLACTAAVVGLACGRVAISHYGTPAVELMIGVPILIAVTARPLVTTVALAALLGSIFAYDYLPRVNVPGHPPINVADVLLAIVVGATIWRRPWNKWPPAVRRYSWILIALLVLTGISSVGLALQGHAQARTAILGYRNLLYLALPLTIALELSSDRLWRPLLDGAIALAAIVSILSVAADASGSVASFVTHFSASSVTSISSPDSFTSTSRIRLPGLFFAYAMCIPTVVMVLTVRDRWRALRLGALVLMVGAIGVSLNRNMYFGVVIGLLVAIMVGGPQLRHRALLSIAIVVAVTALVVESVKPAATAEIAQRAGSALSSQVLTSGSAQARAIEFRFALRSIAKHPLGGVGWLEPYGLDVSDLGVGTGPRVYVEDIYLHLATDYGIPAALAFLLLPCFLLLYGVKRAGAAADPFDRAILGGAIGAVVALLLSCLVGTYLQAPDSTASFAIALGLLLAAALRATPRTSTSPAPGSTAALPAAP